MPSPDFTTPPPLTPTHPAVDATGWRKTPRIVNLGSGNCVKKTDSFDNWMQSHAHQSVKILFSLFVSALITLSWIS
jgi:hypothetical protein